MNRALLAVFLVACGPMAFRIEGGNGRSGTGCAFGVPGEAQQACFSWASSSGLDEGIAAGSSSSIQVAALVPIARVRSSDPSVAAFTLDASGDVQVDAFQPGSADLILYDGRGAVLDRATINVDPTVRLEADVASVRMLSGTRGVFHVSTVGPYGATVGVGAVSFSASGTAWLLGPGLFSDGDETAFTGSRGHGAVVARADAAAAWLDVDFVDSADLVAIDASVSGGAVHVVARSAAGPVYGAACAWATSSRAVYLEDQHVAGFDEAPGADAWFSATVPGRYSATCSIGGLAKTVSLSL